LIIKTTASQSVSFNYPKNPGTFDPNNEEEDDSVQVAIPETFATKLVNEKIETTPEEGLD